MPSPIWLSIFESHTLRMDACKANEVSSDFAAAVAQLVQVHKRELLQLKYNTKPQQAPPQQAPPQQAPPRPSSPCSNHFFTEPDIVPVSPSPVGAIVKDAEENGAVRGHGIVFDTDTRVSEADEPPSGFDTQSTLIGQRRPGMSSSLVTKVRGAVEASSHQYELRVEWQEHRAKSTLQAKMGQTNSLSMIESLFAATGRAHEHQAQPHIVGRSRFVIHPGSYKRICWDLLSMLCLAWDCLTIPFVLAFEPPTSKGMRAITTATMIFWTVDIVLGFITGYHYGKNEVMTRPKIVALHYLRYGFPMDAAVVSVDWFLVVGQSGRKGSVARLGRSIRILKLLKTIKLLRAMKLKKYIQAVQDMITSESVSIWFGIWQVLMILLTVNHIVACLWYTIGSTDCQCNQPGWVEAKHMYDYSLAYRYTSALHWSLAQFTPAPNEIFPQNFYERIFATGVLMGALICFSGFTGTVTAGVMQLKRMHGEQSRAFWQLRRYLKDWQVPQKFRRRVVSYLEYAYEQQRKKTQEKDVVLLSLLSEQLQFELRRMTLKEHLHGHPLFFRLHYSTLVFIKALGTRPLATGDLVCKCGEEGSEMVFVSNGHLEYMKPFLGEEVVKNFPAKYSTALVAYGQWVCEAVLWTEQWIHLGHICAQKECHIISINGKEFGRLLQRNVDLWYRVHCYSARFVEELNTISHYDLSDLMIPALNPELWMDSFVNVLPLPHIASSMDMGTTFWDAFHDVAPRWLRRCIGHWDKHSVFRYGGSSLSFDD